MGFGSYELLSSRVRPQSYILTLGYLGKEFHILIKIKLIPTINVWKHHFEAHHIILSQFSKGDVITFYNYSEAFDAE